MSDRELILAGYSGHGFVVVEAAIASGLNVRHYSEKQPSSINPFALNYLGFEGDILFEGWKESYDFILGIGDNTIRQKVAQLILSKNKKIHNVIHPSASIAQLVKIGHGNFIARNVAISPSASIGSFCILNTGCIIEHECTISNGAHIAPGAVLTANIIVDEMAFIGANAVIKQGVTIGKNAIVGAGAVVTKNVPDTSVFVGNPAREIKRKFK